MENLISLLGFAVFGIIAWGMSLERKKVNWRPVIGGIILQYVIATMIFLVPTTRNLFVWFSLMFNKLLEFSREGITFVFGSLGASNSPQGFVLACQVLPFIVIFSSLMGLLFYWRIIPLVVKGLAVILTRTLKTSGAESLCVASDIFVGIESVTAIRPYITRMTRSELFTILVAGMATIASSVLAVYVSFLKDVFPLIAGHLVSASLISAPATFVICKLMVPETESPETMDIGKCEIHMDNDPKSTIESLIQGASFGGKLAVGVGVTLLAFVGILGIVKGFFAYTTIKMGYPMTLEGALGYVFYPFVWLMGIQPSEIPAISRIMGTRLILTEIPAYLSLAKFAAAGGSPRSVLITSYALCGFTHIASLAIFIGGIGAVAPNKLPLLSKLGIRALIAATLVTMMTGAIAGLFYWGQSGIIQ